jgi:DNA-binding MarR family transcriptional regulator
MMDKEFDANMKIVTDTNGLHVQGAQGLHVQDAQDLHVQSAQDLHVQSAQGLHVQQGAPVQWQDDYGANRRLTLRQKRVLELIAIWLKGEEKTITYIYQRLGKALGMSQRAARVHVDALKKKGLVMTSVAYRKNSKQRIGVCISITPDAPIKHLPHRISDAEMQAIKENRRKEDEFWEQIKQQRTHRP